jgi:hypothetical protein
MGFSRKNCVCALDGRVATFCRSRTLAVNETGFQDGETMSVVDSKLYIMAPLLIGHATRRFVPTLVMVS